MKGFQAAAGLLPPRLERAAEGLAAAQKMRCQEFRLRLGRGCTVVLSGRERIMAPEPVTAEDIRCVIERASQASLHAREEQLAQGYLMAPGGVRVGVCGQGTAGRGGLTGFSSLAVRIPRAVPGCADGLWEDVTRGGFLSSVIVSPPGGGKTTLLRELIRRLSEAGYRVAVADDRGEIGGYQSGRPGFDLGPHTDIMSQLPKGQAIAMLLRAMNPQILAVDEITDPRDAHAILEAVGCGVLLLATVHGAGPADIARRPAGALLLEQRVFRRCITVERKAGTHWYRAEELVWD